MHATFIFQKSKVDTLHQEINLFSRAPCIVRTTYFFGNNGGGLSSLLVEEVPDGVSLHNTSCSGTNCVGINPYTLMARLRPRDLAHYKTIHSLIHLLGVLRKETRRGDQARS